MKPQISILGCGWLGLLLAKSLVEKGYVVKGSTTSKGKLSELENSSITPFIISLDENKIEGSCDDFLEFSTILIINIPPKLRGNSTEDFVKKIKNLIPHIEKSSIEMVVFVSSTSVYSDTYPIVEINEDYSPQPDSESGKQLLETEQMLLSNKNFITFCIRFGGLISEDRHPVCFLAGRKNIENPAAPINLIHRLDCIGIIEAIIGLQHHDFDVNWNQTFNAVAPFHPTRKVYYTQKAMEFNLPIPEFDESKISVGKIISSTNIENVLNYKFQVNKL